MIWNMLNLWVVGMVAGHAYSIIDTKSHKYCCGMLELKLVRVRNPWGEGAEWKGAWSDDSWMWSLFPELAKEINEDEDDGSFWMSISDFVLYFDTVDKLVLDGQPPVGCEV
jgi:hypothetical protein